ncbi:MAG: hypothetical protein HFH49_15030 [Lachnospiraceae bacterium]|nr:hypothetical protein [Lachnospiraceae bacterium]
MELGSEFDLDFSQLTETSDTIFSYLKEFPALYTDSGRSALRLLSGRLAGAKILAPDYICRSVTDALPKDCKVIYYSVDRRFRIDLEQLEELIRKHSARFLYLMYYFGPLQPEDTRKRIAEWKEIYGLTVIEDTTHSLFTARKTVGDYCIASLRKWFPIPDGGVLYAGEKFPIPDGGVLYAGEKKEWVSQSPEYQESFFRFAGLLEKKSLCGKNAETLERGSGFLRDAETQEKKPGFWKAAETLERKPVSWKAAETLERKPVSRKAAAMILKHLFLAEGFDCNAKYREIFAEEEESLNRQKGVYGMSVLSEFLLSHFPITPMCERRRKNAAFLSKELTRLGYDIAVKAEAPEVLLALPVYAAERDRLRERMMEQRVYCAVHWPLERPAVSGDARWMEKHMISLPIDQRYGEEEMEYLLKCMEICKNEGMLS